MASRAEISGVTELSVKINHLREALNGTAQRIRDEALLELGVDISQRAPVDTGELRDSVQVDDDRIRVTAEHAGYVESGTVKMRAQPYVRPAVEDYEARLARLAREEINRELRRL